jgi:hypothetical protein
MITFIVITIISLVVAAIVAAAALIGGAAFFAVFGDLIIFALIVYGLVMLIKKFKKS